MKIGFVQFRKNLDEIFGSTKHRNSVAYQLIDLTDLFQKISAIYEFARKHKNTALQNPIVFQLVESALVYGVCMQIRRLADGCQPNEISLYKLANEIRANCVQWSRIDFVTWDGKPYDPSNLRAEHELEINRIISEWTKNGKSGGCLPTGKHEEIDRRHRIFDLLSSVSSEHRPETEVWTRRIPNYLLEMLKRNAGEIVDFANVYLAHRIHFLPNRMPEFDVSLAKIEQCIASLWKCYNVLNSIFYDTYMTSNIVHSLSSFDGLRFPFVDQNDLPDLIQSYETTKERMEATINIHSREWEADFMSEREAAE
jgi:hypothetical protein